jgi:hypothetical protein
MSEIQYSRLKALLNSKGLLDYENNQRLEALHNSKGRVLDYYNNQRLEALLSHDPDHTLVNKRTLDITVDPHMLGSMIFLDGTRAYPFVLIVEAGADNSVSVETAQSYSCQWSTAAPPDGLREHADFTIFSLVVISLLTDITDEGALMTKQRSHHATTLVFARASLADPYRVFFYDVNWGPSNHTEDLMPREIVMHNASELETFFKRSKDKLHSSNPLFGYLLPRIDWSAFHVLAHFPLNCISRSDMRRWRKSRLCSASTPMLCLLFFVVNSHDYLKQPFRSGIDLVFAANKIMAHMYAQFGDRCEKFAAALHGILRTEGTTEKKEKLIGLIRDAIHRERSRVRTIEDLSIVRDGRQERRNAQRSSSSSSSSSSSLSERRKKKRGSERTIEDLSKFVMARSRRRRNTGRTSSSSRRRKRGKGSLARA